MQGRFFDESGLRGENIDIGFSCGMAAKMYIMIPFFLTDLLAYFYI